MKSVMKTLQQFTNSLELKESIRMMKTQRSDTEKKNLIDKGKRKGTDEIIRQNT